MSDSAKYNNKNEGIKAYMREVKAEAAPMKLRDQYTYTVHTSCRFEADASWDCFYGWNEAARLETCVQHSIIDNLPFLAASKISKLLEQAGYEVVVTRTDDWSKVVTDAHMALHYKAAHAH